MFLRVTYMTCAVTCGSTKIAVLERPTRVPFLVKLVTHPLLFSPTYPMERRQRGVAKQEESSTSLNLPLCPLGSQSRPIYGSVGVVGCPGSASYLG